MTRVLRAFLENQTSIARVISKYRPMKEDIDDLMQDVFLTCFSLEVKEDILEPEHLLHKVAKNLAINQSMRKINKTSAPLPENEDSPVYLDADYVSAEEQLEAKIKLKLFAEAVATLPEKERRVLVMRRVEGLKFKQICTRLGISVRTAERRAASGMLACYKYLRAKGYSAEDLYNAHKLNENNSSKTENKVQ
ncbi:RNA polymerase sigma factor [Hirschia maritima]|uniref:RNA polymerase sigma factor n=1 Tax=Hirschia maritima TaxID=1121961 RepID=UPI0003644496|nr:RNA polymerase sigma factor [Hirschia maritima]